MSHAGESTISADTKTPQDEPTTATVASPSDRLPRRDLLILPLISVVVVIVMLIASETAARYFFAVKDRDTCIVPDGKIGFRFRPNCTARLKIAEGPWVENHYNECGYRTKESCGPKPSGSTRISLIGSSASEGLWVGYDQTFYVRAARDLTRMCGRPIEIQNLGRQHCFPLCSFRRMDEALSLNPDVVMMTITPWDLESLVPSEIPARYEPISAQSASTTPPPTLLQRTKLFVKESRTVVVAQHFLYQDSSNYLRLALLHRDSEDFLRPPFSPEWEARLDGFDRLLGEMAQKSAAKNARFVLIEIPDPAQALLLSSQPPRVGIDPNALNKRLEQISSSHGIFFVNVLDAFRRVVGSEKMFYMVDGHLNGEGEALVSQTLVEQLTQQSNPVLSGCRASEQ